MMLDDNYPIIKGNDNNSNSSNSNNDNRQSLMIKTTRKDSLLALSKSTAAPSRNKYLNLNMNDNNNNNNNMKLKCNDNDYPIASLQSPLSNNKLNNCIKNDDIPSIPLPLQNIIFQPSGSWIERKFLNNNINKNGNHQETDQSSSLYYNNNKYHTLVSYVPSGLSIICHSTIKCIDIHCVGVSLLKIIFYKDSNDNNNNSSSSSSSSPGNNDKITTSNDNNKGNNKKNVITVNEISLPSIDMDDGDCYLPQRVSLTLPYPCIKVDVLLIKRKLDFVSIMGIAAYANTVRSASLSTPHK